MERLKKVMVRVEPVDWDLFKELTKANGSNASVEMRKFIKEYIAQNTNKIKDIVMKSNNKEETNV